MIGNIIKSLRGEEGITQLELSGRIGINNNTLAAYERETREPDIEKICLFADYFGVSIDYLLGRTTLRIPDPDVQNAAKLTGLSAHAIQKLALIHSRKMTPLTELVSLLIEQEELPPNQSGRTEEELEVYYQECQEKGYIRLLSSICGYLRYKATPNSKAVIPGIYDSWEKHPDSFTITYTEISTLLESSALMEIEEQLKMLHSRIDNLWGKTAPIIAEKMEAPSDGDGD